MCVCVVFIFFDLIFGGSLDVFTCGFVGAMFGGLLSASAVLNRNLFADLVAAKAKFSPQRK